MMNVMIVVALHCEAKPLIAALHLKKIAHLNLPFSIFVNKEKTVHLIIAGVGKVKTAAAVSFLFGWTGYNGCSAFLNIGIAGAQCFSIGECVLANKITDASTQKSWYPFANSFKHYPQTALITHDLPQHHYPEMSMVDMEGSAFYQTANIFVTQEHILLAKIISDNDVISRNAINEEKVTELVAMNIEKIVQLIQHLMNTSAQETEIQGKPAALQKFLETWHFTHAQSLQLTEYLRRWQTHSTLDPWQFCKDEKNSTHIIQKLITALDNHAYNLH